MFYNGSILCFVFVHTSVCLCTLLVLVSSRVGRKTALMLELCKLLRDEMSIGAVSPLARWPNPTPGAPSFWLHSLVQDLGEYHDAWWPNYLLISNHERSRIPSVSMLDIPTNYSLSPRVCGGQRVGSVFFFPSPAARAVLAVLLLYGSATWVAPYQFTPR